MSLFGHHQAMGAAGNFIERHKIIKMLYFYNWTEIPKLKSLHIFTDPIVVNIADYIMKQRQQ